MSEERSEQEILNELAGSVKRLAVGTIILLIFGTLLIFATKYKFFKQEVSPEEVEIPKIDMKIEDGIHVQSGLLATEGYELVYQNCGGCHSHKLVIQNRATEQGWTDIIKWMQESHNLWDLGENQEMIVRYLGTNYGPEGKGRRENLKKVEWYMLE